MFASASSDAVLKIGDDRTHEDSPAKLTSVSRIEIRQSRADKNEEEAE